MREDKTKSSLGRIYLYPLCSKLMTTKDPSTLPKGARMMGHIWDGIGLDEMRWDGVGWDEMRCDGMSKKLPGHTEGSLPVDHLELLLTSVFRCKQLHIVPAARNVISGPRNT